MKNSDKKLEITDQHLVWLIQNHDIISTDRLPRICAEFLRRFLLNDEFVKKMTSNSDGET